MKIIKYFILIIATCHILSCACLTGRFDVIQRDEFLNKLSILNTEILGGIKYDDPNLDLRSLHIENYADLHKYADITEDYETVIDFITQNISEKHLVIKHDTFILCLFSEDYQFVLCDDAQTPGVDKIETGEDITNVNDFYENFLKTKCSDKQY